MKPEKTYGTKVYIGTYATSLFIQVCTILQGALLARLLGPLGRGELAAIQLWPSIFASLGLMGVNMALTRRAGKTNDTGPLVKSAVFLSCITGFVSAACGLLFLPFLIPQEMQEILPEAILFLLFIPLNHMALNLLGIDQGSGNFKLFNLTRALLYPVFYIGLTATWFFAENRLLGVIFSLLAGNLAVTISRFFSKWPIFKHQKKHLPFHFLLREGLPYQLTTLFALLSQYIDQILLLWLLSPQEMGLYVVARSSGTVIASLPASLGIVSLAEAARLNKNNGFIPLAKMIRRGGILSTFIALAFLPMLPFLIPFVYGVNFKPSIPIALILLPGIVCSGLSNIIEKALLGHGKPLFGISAKTAGIVTIILAGGIGTHYWGITGLAIGFTFSQFAVLLVFLRLCVKYFKNGNLKSFFPQLNDFIFLINKTHLMLSKILNN